LVLAAFFLGIHGIGRSLWTDEAWVANSVNAPSMSGMFYYPDWLQTSPPLFLILVRMAVHAFGLSNLSLRIVPLLFGILAVANMAAVARKALSLPFAMLVCAVLVFSPAAVEYSRTLKQYSAELAASTTILLAAVRYFESPARARYFWLLAAVCVALPLAYPVAFFLPGLVLAVYFTPAGGSPPARAAILAAAAGAIVLAEYFYLALPNISPVLREFWANDADSRVSRWALTSVLSGAVLLGARPAFALFRSEPEYSRHSRTQIVCIIPCILFAISGFLKWYPVSHRTRLFLLPCFLLVLGINSEWLLRRGIARRSMDFALVGLICLIAGLGIRREFRGDRQLPEEDVEAAVLFLRGHVAPSDLLAVHASCREGFKLYAAMYTWKPPHVIFGDTGGPCCSREQPALDAQMDLDAKVPHDLPGRVWLFYTTRAKHWSYAGLDESKVWNQYFAKRGCSPQASFPFRNLGVNLFGCP
jgi:4-amino-4-deoxy-L-arabinose transferase-like glycosyltransferase